MKYKVRFHIDNKYKVCEEVDDAGYTNTLFTGSLADCESWIRLREGGYM